MEEIGGRKRERDFHGKRCVRSRKATTSPLPGRRKCLLVRKGSVFPSGGGGIKAARDQSGIGGAIRWAHNASIPTPPILPPVKGFSIIEEMAKAVYRRRLVHFSRGWIERGSALHQSICESYSSQMLPDSTTINLTWIIPLIFVSWWRSERQIARFRKFWWTSVILWEESSCEKIGEYRIMTRIRTNCKIVLRILIK